MQSLQTGCVDCDPFGLLIWIEGSITKLMLVRWLSLLLLQSVHLNSNSNSTTNHTLVSHHRIVGMKGHDFLRDRGAHECSLCYETWPSNEEVVSKFHVCTLCGTSIRNIWYVSYSFSYHSLWWWGLYFAACLSACLSCILMFISYHIDVITITINYNHILDSLIWSQ